MKIKFSPLQASLHVLTSGMKVQNQRVLIISENLANVGVKASRKGEKPYQRKLISFKTVYNKSIDAEVVEVKKISNDETPFDKVYSPHDPACDKYGFVEESNVKPMIELSDMKEASRAFDACLKAFERTQLMTQNVISLLK